jgi:hypothetical protein
MLKPFVWGAVLGGAALTIVAFSAGWVVTTSSRDDQVLGASIDAQAQVCATLAQNHRAATGDVTSLSGFGARDARDSLAKAFVVVLRGQSAADPMVITACSKQLDKPNV